MISQCNLRRYDLTSDMGTESRTMRVNCQLESQREGNVSGPFVPFFVQRAAPPERGCWRDSRGVLREQSLLFHS